MSKKFVSVFHSIIIAAFLLTGCGFKADPVYKKDGVKVDYNATESNVTKSLP